METELESYLSMTFRLLGWWVFIWALLRLLLWWGWIWLSFITWWGWSWWRWSWLRWPWWRWPWWSFLIFVFINRGGWLSSAFSVFSTRSYEKVLIWAWVWAGCIYRVWHKKTGTRWWKAPLSFWSLINFSDSVFLQNPSLNCQLPLYSLLFAVLLFTHILVILSLSSLLLKKTIWQKEGDGYFRIGRWCLQGQKKSKGINHVRYAARYILDHWHNLPTVTPSLACGECTWNPLALKQGGAIVGHTQRENMMSYTGVTK